jgi:hypothetical protein
MKKKLALAGVAATLAAAMIVAYAVQNVWVCQTSNGGYYCYVSGTRG